MSVMEITDLLYRGSYLLFAVDFFQVLIDYVFVLEGERARVAPTY